MPLADPQIRSDVHALLPANGELALAGVDTQLIGSRIVTRACEDQVPGAAWQLDPHPEADPSTLQRRLIAAFSETGLWPLSTDDDAMGEAGSRSRHMGISECPLDTIRALFGLDGRSEYEVQEEDFCFVCGPLADPTGTVSVAADRADVEALEALLGGVSSGNYGRYSPPPAGAIALVPADGPADSISRIGWTGGQNQGWGAGDAAIVLRSWEDRFGAYVVAASRSTLDLLVARPPTDIGMARLVARELLHFCPYDTQFHGFGGIEPYAQSLVGSSHWRFWWD
jgi:hypothetical protein